MRFHVNALVRPNLRRDGNKLLMTVDIWQDTSIIATTSTKPEPRQMTTIENTTGSKAVNFFSKDGTIRCMYVQRYNGEEQVLDSKTYKSERAATKWALGKLA